MKFNIFLQEYLQNIPDNILFIEIKYALFHKGFKSNLKTYIKKCIQEKNNLRLVEVFGILDHTTLF